MYIYIYIYTYVYTCNIYIYIYMYIEREMYTYIYLAPRNRFLVWTVKPSGRHCTETLGGNTSRGVPTPLRKTSLFSKPDTVGGGCSGGGQHHIVKQPIT